jgi:hypothetical protein
VLPGDTVQVTIVFTLAAAAKPSRVLFQATIGRDMEAAWGG